MWRQAVSRRRLHVDLMSVPTHSHPTTVNESTDRPSLPVPPSPSMGARQLQVVPPVTL